MNKNILIVFGGAVAIALVVALLVQVSLGGKKKQAPVVVEAKTSILVAAKGLSVGQELKSDDMRWQEWPKNSVFPGAITRKDKEKTVEAVSGRLARPVASGEPVTKSAILGQAKGNFVAASLGPGMRAIAIEVSASSMVGGFIGPGDFIDLILTYRESVDTDDENPLIQSMIELNLEKYATETILQNVKVLAVDQRSKPAEDDEKIKVGKTVTLAVNSQDAERVSLARELGDLNLVLRGVGDDVIFEKNWATISDARLTTIDNEIYTEYDKIKKDAGINPDIVRIYRGDQVTVVPTP